MFRCDAAAHGYSSFVSLSYFRSFHGSLVGMCTLISGRCDVCRTYVHLASSPLSSHRTGGTGRVWSLTWRCCLEHMLLSLMSFFAFISSSRVLHFASCRQYYHFAHLFDVIFQHRHNRPVNPCARMSVCWSHAVRHAESRYSLSR